MTEVVHSCRVRGCRFMNSHSTRGHRCGICGEYGHGVMECNNNRSVENLHFYDNEVTPGERCTFPGCPNPETHTDSAHHCHRCGRLGESSINCIIQPYNVHRGRFYDEPYLNHFDINEFILDLNNRHGVVPIFLGMGCTLWVRVRFQINDEPELMSLFMHSDAYGQYGEASNDLPRLEAFKDGCIEYNPNSFSNYNGASTHTTDTGTIPNLVNAPNLDDNNTNTTNNSNSFTTNIGTTTAVANNNLNQIINNNILNNNNQLNSTINLNNEFIHIFDYIHNNADNNINNDLYNIVDNNDIIINDDTNDDTINDDTINEIIDDSLIGNVAHNNILCPLCRTESCIDTQVHDIRGSSDMCSVCMDRNVEIFLGGCGHACMCRECFQQIREIDTDELIG